MTTYVDASKIENPRARHLLWDIRWHGETNRRFYRDLPTDKLDCRVRCDSPRDSLLHHVYVTRNYVHSVRSGSLRWGIARERLLMPYTLRTAGKRQLLDELESADLDLAVLLSEPDIESRCVCLPWSETPSKALDLLSRLVDHEVLQISCNLALMRALRLEMPALQVGAVATLR